MSFTMDETEKKSKLIPDAMTVLAELTTTALIAASWAWRTSLMTSPVTQHTTLRSPVDVPTTICYFLDDVTSDAAHDAQVASRWPDHNLFIGARQCHGQHRAVCALPAVPAHQTNHACHQRTVKLFKPQCSARTGRTVFSQLSAAVVRHKTNDGVAYAIRAWFKYDTALSAVV